MANWILYAGLAVVVVMFFVALAILGIVVIVKLFGGKGKAKAAPLAPATFIAPSAPSFLETLKGGTAGAHAKIDAACEDHAVSETLKHLFVATKHLVKDEATAPVAPPVPNPPPAPSASV